MILLAERSNTLTDKIESKGIEGSSSQHTPLQTPKILDIKGKRKANEDDDVNENEKRKHKKGRNIW